MYSKQLIFESFGCCFLLTEWTSLCRRLVFVFVFSSTAAEGRRGDNFLWLCFLIESSPISLWSIWSQAPTILYFHLCAKVQNCSSSCLCPTELTKSSMLMLQKPRKLDWFYGGHIGGLCVVGVCRRTRGLQEWKPCRCHPFASRYENKFVFLFFLCPKLCSTSWVWWRRVWVLVFFLLFPWVSSHCRNKHLFVSFSILKLNTNVNHSTGQSFHQSWL